MPLWTEKRRWKRSAEQAIATVLVGPQREQLAAEVCRRVLAAKETDGEGVASGMVWTAALRLLDDAMVRSSLGLRYLDALDESLRTASYEDARALCAEAQWAREFIVGQAPCPLLNGAELEQSTGPGDARGKRLERLQGILATRLAAQLAAAEIAA